MVKNPTWVQKALREAINPDSVPYPLKDGEATKSVMDRVGKSLGNFLGKPSTIEPLEEHFGSVNQAFDVIKTSDHAADRGPV